MWYGKFIYPSGRQTDLQIWIQMGRMHNGIDLPLLPEPRSGCRRQEGNIGRLGRRTGLASA